MATGHDYSPNWVVLPGALVTVELVTRDWTKKPIIEIIGNRQGLFSLGALLLWVSLHSPDTESISITGLVFVQFKSTISLIVVQPMEGSDRYGKLIRTDKDKQFQWLIKDELLERQAIALMDVAFTPDGYCGDHFHGNVGPDSEYELFFARNDLRREFSPTE